MKTLARLGLAGGLLLVTAFCTLGFLASFEPGDRHRAWRFGYAALGLIALLSGLRVARCLVVKRE